VLKFEKLSQDRKYKDDSAMFHLYRTKIPGGWLVLMRNFDLGGYSDGGYGWGYGGATFIPDPDHTWDGSSID
jgi:hypothetical protein